MVGEQIANNLIERFNPTSVLFCPYKEEMWDSMESIYENMKVNKDGKTIITDIMPIAYYTLRGGKIDDIKIEFNDCKHHFPMLLHNGHSEKYGGSKKWDIIVFHYPYDNLNNVTRPVILSNELKAFCHHLVLVHYACRTSDDITAQDVCYGGIRNSDIVIFDNEIQAKKANDLLAGQPNWNGECVGWGCAKYDLVETAEIPPWWIKKAEGKRVVLLQSSIIPYLRNRQKINQVESYIMSYIKNPKVCLIWRPHPLYRETIIAHQRKDLKLFDDLLDMVRDSPKDILDTTPTPEISIKFADEMISDKSSLIMLWKATGKKLTLLED